MSVSENDGAGFIRRGEALLVEGKAEDVAKVLTSAGPTENQRLVPVVIDGTALGADPKLIEPLKQVLAELRRAGAEVPEPKPGESLWEYFHRKPAAELWSKDNRPAMPVIILKGGPRFLESLETAPAMAMIDLAYHRHPRFVSALPPAKQKELELRGPGQARVLIALDSPVSAKASQQLSAKVPARDAEALFRLVQTGGPKGWKP